MQLWTLYGQFQTAIQFNDLSAAELLLKQGIDSDFRFGLARIPALCMSAKSGHYDLVRLLINHGCSVNQTDENGLSALHYACSYLFVDIARLLIQNRADINRTNLYGCTPLHLAIQHKSIELIDLLIESGSLIEKCDCNGQTPLLIACKLCNYETVKYLLEKGANVNTVDKEGNTPLLLAINSSLSINTILVKLILNAGADPNQGNMSGMTPLLTTIRRSSDHITEGQETVQALIDHNCDINAHEYQSPFFGENALNLAISRSQDAITETLIRSGAKVEDKSIQGQPPFVRLIKDDKTDLAKLALANVSHISQADYAQIENDHHRISVCDPELYKYLIKDAPIFPTLKHLSRLKLRIWLGRRADQVFKNLKLPTTFKNYLLMKEL